MELGYAAQGRPAGPRRAPIPTSFVGFAGRRRELPRRASSSTADYGTRSDAWFPRRNPNTNGTMVGCGDATVGAMSWPRATNAKTKFVFHARVLGKGKGTPMLKNGIKCLAAIPDPDESDLNSDWQGFT